MALPRTQGGETLPHPLGPGRLPVHKDGDIGAQPRAQLREHGPGRP